jgi:hypothetical protein
MDPWKAFKTSVPWFLDLYPAAGAKATGRPGTWHPLSEGFSSLFPELERLLTSAHVTEIDTDDTRFVLFSWLVDDETSCWLTEPPVDAPPMSVCAPHQVLLKSLGGIVERSDEPPSWLLNHNDVFTLKEASFDASFLSDYAWAFPNETVPIEPKLFYSVGREANGNTTLCHRDTAEILLFAHDHSFDHVRPWKGLPEYTLYTLEGAPNFASFVETIAKQWLAALKSP